MRNPRPAIVTAFSIVWLLMSAAASAQAVAAGVQADKDLFAAASARRRTPPSLPQPPTVAPKVNPNIAKLARVKLTPTYILTGHALKLYRSPDSGATWATYEFGTNTTIKATVAVDPSFFVGVGGSGKVVVTRDAGTSWTIGNVGADVLLEDVAFIPADPAKVNQTPCFIAVGYKADSAGIFISQDAAAWQRTGSFTGGKLMTTAASPKGQVVAIGDYGFLYSHDYGQTWKQASWQSNHIPLTETIGNVYDVIYDPASSLFAFVCYGDRTNVRSFNFRTSVDGSVWQVGQENLSDLSERARGIVQADKTIYTRQLATDGKGMIITTPDMRGSYYSADGGRTWRLFYQNLPAGVTTRIMDIAWDGQRFVGVSYNETPDGGKYLCYSPNGAAWTTQPLPKATSQLGSNITIGIINK